MTKTLHQNYFTIGIKISETENAASYFFITWLFSQISNNINNTKNILSIGNE